MTKTVTILGSTGSIGDSTLDIISRAPQGTYKVIALTANNNAEKLAAQAKKFGAEFVALANPDKAGELRTLLDGTGIEMGAGPQSLIEAATRPADFTMAAIIGAAGLEPTLAAVKQGNHVGLANKECLVCAGETFMAAVKQNNATLLPVDSEHNAIFQVLESDQPAGIKRLILTASGGPFREHSFEQLENVTRENALNHPVWSMGAKISIDSATLMNKGLELIEASYLFNRPSAEIDVIVHPQSIIHSMVEYIDGSVLAQLGSPDMRTPIAYAMGWPNRISAPVQRLDFTQISALTFFEPDTIKFPALRLAREALETGGQAPTILNAANEIAVAAFLDGKITFLDIARIVEKTLNKHAGHADFLKAPDTVEAVIAVDFASRATADEILV
ncbi:MAG: 1-deoxy-D-xylulose-5-phosphate reductoisomerase [Litorimonas sp.]